MSGTINNKLGIIDKALIALNSKHCFGNAQAVIDGIISLLDVPSKDKWVLFNDNQGKIRSNASFFMQAEGFADKRAAYKIADGSGNNVDIKAFWLKNSSKANVSWAVALTPNFEDAPYFADLNVGIDFIIPEEADRVIIVLSKNYVIRTLELEESLKVTQQEILAKWLQPIDFSNKAQAHEILWSSFDLEPVNKQFYKDISGFFTELRQYLSEDIKYLDEKHAAQFANRLLGRIIFCWFLNKKGVISPDNKYFDAEAEDGTKYYKGKLETLFFKVLNTEVNKREKGVDRTTPFLNGGIFEPKEFDGFEDKKLKFPKDYFIRLYGFFKHYNFTTDESTSTYQQIAIDPEMLGRIFENLLAEQVEETGEQARKAKGAFYTPREIVDFMCKESLREYLKTRLKDDQNKEKILGLLLDTKDHEFRDQARNYRADLKQYKYDIEKALDEVKIIDPACGSGAFPMGMLHLILASYERIEPSIDHYKKKMEIIKNSIFGVDIEPMAIEIARLRVWLSIVVDEHAKTGKIDPLPNLVFKFVCANSLVKLKNESVQYAFDDDTSLEGKVSEAREEYFVPGDYKAKKAIKEKFYKYMEAKNKDNKGIRKSELSKQLESYDPFRTDISALFFDSKMMLGVERYDICIGNPPYVQLQRNHGALANLYENVGYKTFERTGDIYCLFYELGLQLVKKETGIFCYITSNKWMRSSYGEALREYFSKMNPLILIDLGADVFESAMVDTNIMLLQNSENRDVLQALNYNQSLKEKISFAEIYKTNKVFSPNQGKETWFIGSLTERNLKEKIENIGKPLSDWDVKIFRGVLTGLNEAFIIDKTTRDQIIKEDSNSKEICKPVLGGSDLIRYYYDFGELYLLQTGFDTNIPKKYPSIMKHLRKYEEKAKIRNDQGENWWNLRSCDYYDDFEKEKVVWLNLNRKWKYSYVEPGIYLDVSLNTIASDKYAKLLVGVLSSKVHLWFFKKTGRMHDDGGFMCKIDSISKFRVPLPDESNKDIYTNIEKIVNSIIKTKKKDPKSETSSLELEIDRLVYKLYKLTADEIKIVEGSKL
ncbi:MAG: hypothetical protein A2452_08355 [Candidatus Firestonebacteria bacterium RIFOXYC2_FULL_39_67]|nr:MAG: hypothetical protein A2536_05340 [Candidatus Firestonebacteria bacterium RIFOXYD2_FULL_39_29]OGF56932.1 MAG: hypothetical protein A2452_08355 [Candidatus Firestonebacteria bacterium RIFOXYC2_FULL_39_67]